MPNITIYDDTDTHFRNMRLWKNDILEEDTFDDEMFLVLRTNEGLVIISGCAHRGICNMIASAKTYFNQPILATIGGFHTIRESEEKVVSLANKLNGFGIKRIYTCHCTGIDKYLILKSTCNAEVNYASTGDVITIE